MKPKLQTSQSITKINPADMCQTPPHALEPLIPYLPTNAIIWEPACGPELLICKKLQLLGYDVIGTDLLYDQNFFTYKPYNIDLIDIIVTNPPYSIKYQWIERCFELGKPFALLIPFETLASKKLDAMVEKYCIYEPIEILKPIGRIQFKMPQSGWDGGGAQFPTCWFTFGLDIGSYKTSKWNIFSVPIRNPKYNENNKEIIL